MDEVYTSLAVLAILPPAAYLARRLGDYGVAKYAYGVGLIDTEPTFSNSPMICKEADRKSEEIYERMCRRAEESVE